MKRRDFLRYTAGLAAMPLASQARRPNIIVILADDMGYADVGFTGCTDIPTPHIDALAKAGVRCTNGYVSHPFCSPTRAGLMTGRYQQRFGHENNPAYDPSDHALGLPVSETTLPRVLRDAGYATGLVGKWHLGAAPELHPLQRGFAEQFGFIGGGHDYFRAEPGSRREYFIPLERNGKPVEEREYLTDAFTREACAFVRRHAGDPFFLLLTYNAPHTPQQAAEKYLDRFAHLADPKRKLYAAMVSAVDDGVGRLSAALRELNVESDTLVFFLSDNGGPVGVNGSRNDPFRAAKGQVYEGGVHVPFAVRWPARIPAGSEFRHPVISLDIFPTAAAAAGLKSRAGLDGVDLSPHLSGRNAAPPHSRLFWRMGGGDAFAVREGNLKLVRLRGRAPELYDLERDPGEARDLAAEQPQTVKRMESALDAWARELKPPRFPNPGQAGKKA